MGKSEETTIIKLEVEEKSTGEISFGAGFSSLDGPLANVGIRERNLLGRGQDLNFNFQGSASRQEFKIGFTEPYFMERRLSAGFDLFQVMFFCQLVEQAEDIVQHDHQSFRSELLRHHRESDDVRK